MQADNNDELWQAAYQHMIDENTRKLKIKYGWNNGSSLCDKLSTLKKLASIDVTG